MLFDERNTWDDRMVGLVVAVIYLVGRQFYDGKKLETAIIAEARKGGIFECFRPVITGECEKSHHLDSVINIASKKHLGMLRCDHEIYLFARKTVLGDAGRQVYLSFTPEQRREIETAAEAAKAAAVDL